jgi:hypothetical protein
MLGHIFDHVLKVFLEVKKKLHLRKWGRRNAD